MLHILANPEISDLCEMKKEQAMKVPEVPLMTETDC